MKKILLAISILSVVLIAENSVALEGDDLPTKIYLQEEVEILKKNGMNSLDLENLNNGKLSKEGLRIINKSKGEMNKKIQDISDAIIVKNKQKENLSDNEKLKKEILLTYPDIRKKDLEKFILFNFIGKVSFAVERDVIFKDIPNTDVKSKNDIKKGDIENVVKNEFKNKEEFIFDILSSFQKEAYEDIIKNYSTIIKGLSVSFTDKEVKLIEKTIKKELAKK